VKVIVLIKDHLKGLMGELYSIQSLCLGGENIWFGGERSMEKKLFGGGIWGGKLRERDSPKKLLTAELGREKGGWEVRQR